MPAVAVAVSCVILLSSFALPVRALYRSSWLPVATTATIAATTSGRCCSVALAGGGVRAWRRRASSSRPTMRCPAALLLSPPNATSSRARTPIPTRHPPLGLVRRRGPPCPSSCHQHPPAPFAVVMDRTRWVAAAAANPPKRPAASQPGALHSPCPFRQWAEVPTSSGACHQRRRAATTAPHDRVRGVAITAVALAVDGTPGDHSERRVSSALFCSSMSRIQ